MKHVTYTLSSIFLTVAIIACSSDNESENSPNVEDARVKQLTNFYDHQIIDLQEMHIATATSFVLTIENFNENPTPATLEQVRTSWKETFLIWKQIEPFTLGSVSIGFFHNRIQRWPIETVFIENEINGSDVIDVDFITSLGATSKGYTTAEYLLFQHNESITLNSFTSDTGAVRRRDFLLALAQNIQQEALSLQAAWVSLETEFKSELATSVNGSQNKLVNSLIAGLEFIKNTKLENALNEQPIAPTLLEAYRSEYSKEAIAQNIATIKAAYTGDFNNVAGFGLEEYLVETLENPTLNTEIINSFETINTALQAIPSSLEETLSSNPTLIENLRNALSTLVTLMKADFASAANIIVTFSDNDGD